jgi:hypothetical protein
VQLKIYNELIINDLTDAQACAIFGNSAGLREKEGQIE